MSTRWRVKAYGSAVAVAVAGGLCAVFIPGLAGQLLALTLISVALGAIVLLVFFEVGKSEDRERARAERAHADRAQAGRRDRARTARAGDQPRRRSEWLRGRRRRP